MVIGVRRGLISLAVVGLLALLGWAGATVVSSSGILTLLAAAARAPTSEPARTPRIGYLGSLTRAWPAPLGEPRVDVFRDGLRQQGYVEGANIVIEYRFAEGDFGRLSGLAADLVRLNVDAIVLGDTSAIRYAREATSTIPLVMSLSSDPVRSGFATSLHRPGGNVTGMTLSTIAVDAKRLELFREMVPSLRRVAILWAKNDISDLEWEGVKTAAAILDLELLSYETKGDVDIHLLLEQMVEDSADGIFVFGTLLLNPLAPQVAAHARRLSLPLAGSNVEWVKAGALMTYVPDYGDLYRRAAGQVRRILHGAAPAALPIEQPSRFDLAVNLSTAEALHLEIPRSIRIRATDVVQ